MPATSLQELFVEELRDMYDAEKRMTRALPKMAKAADSSELQSALREHLQETERQIGRLEQVFRSIGEKPRGRKCDGMMGIIEENDTALHEMDGAVLDAAIIAGAQKAEHYEIASYGTLAYFAELLGQDRARNLLGENLDEEKAADEKLNRIAMSQVNRQALREANDGIEGGNGRARPRSSKGAGRTSTSRASSTGRKRTGSRSSSQRSR